MRESGKSNTPARLFLADVSALADAELFRRGLEREPGWRREKTERYRRGEDRRLSLGAGLLLSRACRELGAAGEAEHVVFGPDGKPDFLPETGLHFSLSHSGTKVLCLIAGTEAGCDTEKLRPISPKLGQRYFAPEEAAFLREVPEALRQTSFFRLWTAKEAFLKCLGTGLRLELNTFSVLPALERGETLSVSGGAYSLFSDPQPEGYVCACCLRGKAIAPPLTLIEDLTE